MTNAFEKVASYVARHNLLTGARGVVVAVSGGPDSVALLDMLVRLRDAGGRAGLRLHIAHLNHQLRGRQAEEDAEFVRGLAESLKLEATIEVADVQRTAAEVGRGIEEVGRDLRYRFLLDLTNAAGFDRIATGHTMSDQAETILMRLARGAGPHGLAGMRAAAAVPVSDADRQELAKAACPGNGAPKLIRPLLCIARAEVEEYCRERSLDFRIDASNHDIDFNRNRVRMTVLPALHAINPRVVQAIARAAEDIAAEHDALDHIASSLLESTARLDRGLPGERSDGSGLAYRVSAFLSVPAGLRCRMLIEAIRTAAVSEGGEVGRRHLSAVEHLLEDGASGKRVRLPSGLEVWREFESLVFRQLSVATAEKAAAGYIYELGSRLQVDGGGITLAMSRGLSSDDWLGLIEEAGRTRKEGRRDWVFAALDDEALPAMLMVRPRQRGERGLVLGHQQTIKLKKLMIDHKIPASRRALWPVVTTPDGRYIWSPGLPPAVDFAARDETRAIAIVRALNL